MSAWRRKAIELLPERKAVIERVDSPMALWIELNIAARCAFEARPIDEGLLRAVFAYARYCWASPDGDVLTAVVVAFFENVVTSPAARADLHRWISPTVPRSRAVSWDPESSRCLDRERQDG